MKDLGIKIKWKDLESISMQMVQSIVANGKIINITEGEYISFLMEQLIKENGKTILCTVPDFILMLMEEKGKVNIEMVNFKLKDKNNFFKKNKSK